MSATCERARLFWRSAMAWHDGRLDFALRYAKAMTDAECGQGHMSCELAPFWHVSLHVKAREFETGWRVLNSAGGYMLGTDGAPGPESGENASASPSAAATWRVMRGELLFAMGRGDEGMAEVETGLRLAERCGARSLLPPGYVVMALGALRRADMRACQQFVERLAGEALLGYFGQAAGAWVTALVAEARGGVECAAGLVAGIVTNPVVLHQLLVSEPAAASWLVRVCTKLDADELAERVVSAAGAAAAQQQELRVVRGAASHIAGLRDGDSGALSEAVCLYPDRWCAASAREDLASLLARRRSERDAAVRLFESALGGYTAVGATRDASRVVNKLRDLGVRRGAVRAVDRAGEVPFGLTGTEFAVADLVSQGNTNSEVGRQLFISRHTVAFHLKKVYQKMSVTSRVELAASWKATVLRAVV